MEFMDTLEEFSGSNDQSIIIKGKRTKRRQRPISPVGRVAAATSSSSSGGDGGGGGDKEILGYIYSSNPSCNTSSSSDQEDEDMANCLILLAQGKSVRKQDDQDHEVIKMEEKYSSRRFNEMATSTTGGKVGFFVYECKTCNRTFPSFQALGGHRASHKKPKISIGDNKSATIFTTSSNDLHHEKDKESREEESNNKVVLLQSSSSSNNKGGKIHECSICGAEFGSGQALGGHMRRHRNYHPSTTTKVAMILETSNSSSHDDDHVEKPRNIFPLDLNLPAPSEDDILQRDLKFHQFSANQQSHLVFSAPALVDCHY